MEWGGSDRISKIREAVTADRQNILALISLTNLAIKANKKLGNLMVLVGKSFDFHLSIKPLIFAVTIMTFRIYNHIRI